MASGSRILRVSVDRGVMAGCRDTSVASVAKLCALLRESYTSRMGMCRSIIAVAMGSATVFATPGCSQECRSAPPCRPNVFTVTSNGMCIMSITSTCRILRPSAGDAGTGCDFATVYPPAAGSTCNVVASFADGSQSNITVDFVHIPDDPCCFGDQYNISPPDLMVSARDGGTG